MYAGGPIIPCRNGSGSEVVFVVHVRKDGIGGGEEVSGDVDITCSRRALTYFLVTYNLRS